MDKIIDAHVHLFENVKGWGYKGECRPIGGGKVSYDTGEVLQKYPGWLVDRSLTAERMLAFMDEHRIERCVMMQGPSYGLQNQYYSEIQRNWPDRFIGAAMVDPEVLNFEIILENFISNLGFKVFKLELSTIAGLQGAHMRSNSFESPNMEKLFSAIEHVHGTLALDIGGPDEISYRPNDILRLIEKHPGMNLVICHLLEPLRDWDDQLRFYLLKFKLPNIWFDISSLPTILDEQPPYEIGLRYIDHALEIVGADRLLWGSDTPGSLVKQDYETMLNLFVLNNRSLSEMDKKKITYQNALKAYSI